MKKPKQYVVTIPFNIEPGLVRTQYAVPASYQDCVVDGRLVRSDSERSMYQYVFQERSRNPQEAN